jgi:rSAM/selenodomain-associated transferase 1
MRRTTTEDARGAVVVMAKAPREGLVKTRLTSAYAPRDVVQLSECMLLDTVALAQALSRVHVAVMCPSGDVADVAARLPAAVQVTGQGGIGLAAALASVFECFVPDFRRVIALDSDSPHLRPRILESAFDLLETNDMVVGPSEDGGYYLVGASAARPRLFDPAPLGTCNARDALLANARARGMSVAFTEPWYDVDVPADLRRLAAELSLEPARAPRTAALLACWPAGLDGDDEELAG